MAETHLLLCPGPSNPRCNSPLLHHDRHLPASSRSGTHASWWKFGSTPLCLLSCTFSFAQWNYDIYDHELLVVILALRKWHQYLQGTTHPHHHYHQPQKSLLHQRPSKTIQMASQMVPLPSGLWPALAGYSRNENGPSRCTLETKSCYYPGQWEDCNMSGACHHPGTGPCLSLKKLILHPVRLSSASSP